MNTSTKISAVLLFLFSILFVGISIQANMIWWSILLITLFIATYIIDHNLRKQDAMHPVLTYIPLVLLIIFCFGIVHGNYLLKEHPLDTYVIEWIDYNSPATSNDDEVVYAVVQTYGIFDIEFDKAITTNLAAMENYDLIPDVGLVQVINNLIFFPGMILYAMLFVMYNNENGKTLALLEFISLIAMLLVGLFIIQGSFRIGSPLLGGIWLIVVSLLYTLYYYLRNNKVNSVITKYIPLLLVVMIDGLLVLVIDRNGSFTNMLIPTLYLNTIYAVMFVEHYRTVKRHSKRRELKGIIMMSGSRTGGMTAGIRNDSSFLQTTEAFIQEQAKSKLVEDVTYINQDND